MALGINFNSAAESSQRLLGTNQQLIEKLVKTLASGQRVNQASDDAAGMAISERLDALSQGLDRAQANLQDSTSALQVAEGGMSTINDSVQRIRELSVQAANDTLSDSDRDLIQKEVDQLVAEVDRQAETTTFNGQKLLDGSFGAATPFTTQAGAQQGETVATSVGELSTSTLGIAGLDVSTRANAETAIGNLDTAITRLSDEQANLGSNINRFQAASDFVGIARENTLSALSGIRDADYAEGISAFAQAQIRGQAGVSALAQSNLSAQNVLQLLG